MNEQELKLDLERKAKRFFLNATCFVLLFIFYASLLPYNMTSTSIDMSFSGFLSTLQYSEQSAEQGQWIGHVIFNALLTFLASLYCGLCKQKQRWYFVFGSIFVFGFLIEYFQMFIGNRGTSISDVYANIAGMVFGFMAWVVFGNFSIRAVFYYFEHQTLPVEFVKKIYLAFVVAVILFPFDFFINGLQFQIAFATKGYPLFETDMDQGIGTISLIAAMLLTFPLGVLYRMARRKKRRKKKGKVIIFNMSVLFLLLEILQFFEVSGQSSLPSLFCKAIGFIVGFSAARFLDLNILFDFIVRIRKFFFALVPVFIWVALKIKGLSFEIPASVTNIMTVIEQTSFLPFRYYVEVGSGEALLSFLLNFVIFMPLGGIIAIHYIAVDKVRGVTSSRLMRIGFATALSFEIIVLVWGLKRPDITNVLLAGFALPIGYLMVMMVKNGLDAPVIRETQDEAPSSL